MKKLNYDNLIEKFSKEKNKYNQVIELQKKISNLQTSLEKYKAISMKKFIILKNQNLRKREIRLYLER